MLQDINDYKKNSTFLGALQNTQGLYNKCIRRLCSIAIRSAPMQEVHFLACFVRGLVDSAITFMILLVDDELTLFELFNELWKCAFVRFLGKLVVAL